MILLITDFDLQLLSFNLLSIAVDFTVNAYVPMGHFEK